MQQYLQTVFAIPDLSNPPTKVHLIVGHQPRKGGDLRLGLEYLPWPVCGHGRYSTSINIIWVMGKNV